MCVQWGVWRWLAAAATVPAAVSDRMLVDQPLLTTSALLVTSLGLVVLAWRGCPDRVSPSSSAPCSTAAGGVAGLLADLSPRDPGVASIPVGALPAGLALLVAGAAAIGLAGSAIG